MRALSFGLVALTCATTVLCVAGAQRRALEGGGRRRYHRVQHGHCSYTFVLPEADPPPCPSAPAAPGPANALLQRDSPAGTAHAGYGAAERLRHLERILENSTQWLLKVGCWATGRTGGRVAWAGVCLQYPNAQHPRTGCLLRAAGGRAGCAGGFVPNPSGSSAAKSASSLQVCDLGLILALTSQRGWVLWVLQLVSAAAHGCCGSTGACRCGCISLPSLPWFLVVPAGLAVPGMPWGSPFWVRMQPCWKALGTGFGRQRSKGPKGRGR